MSVVLTTRQGRACLEIADHKGECWLYEWSVSRGRHGIVVRLCCLDPETGEPATDRAGRERTYAVTLGDGWTACHCPDAKFRARKEQRECKHCGAARELVQLLRAMGHPAVAPAKEQAS